VRQAGKLRDVGQRTDQEDHNGADLWGTRRLRDEVLTRSVEHGIDQAVERLSVLELDLDDFPELDPAWIRVYGKAHGLSSPSKSIARVGKNRVSLNLREPHTPHHSR
jgi:hypothetical protein